MLVRSVLRAAMSTTVLLALYYFLPLDERSGLEVAVTLVVGILVIVVVLVLNVVAIVKSDYPRLRAFDAVVVVLPLLIVIFAAIYVQIAAARPTAFSEPMNRTDTLYFTVTVLSTVGFGDITPTSTAARVVTMVQMVGDLVLFGIFAKLFAGVIAEGLSRRSASTAADDGA
jgi:voltage-gated potassium channel